MTHQQLPSGTTDADRFARSLALLRGPEIQPGDGTLVAADLRALGQALADVRATRLRAVAQAHPGTATVLLGDLEREYGLPDGSRLPTDERQRRLVAKYRARASAARSNVLRTLQALYGAAAIVGVWADSVAGTDPYATFRVIVLVDVAAWADDLSARLGALLDQQLGAHAGWVVTPHVGFLCDDPTGSQCDRDVLAF